MWPKLRALNADTSVCGRLLTSKCASIRTHAEQKLLPLVTNHITKKVAKLVQAVNEV